MERVSKINYYLDIAQTVSERSTCLRKRFGAIIVKNDSIVSTGYNGAPRLRHTDGRLVGGAPRGRENCCDLRFCLREHLGIPRGERYEMCRSVHAEANAIIAAARENMIGSTLYMACTDPADGKVIGGVCSCMMCKKMVINAGIEKVIIRENANEYSVYEISGWVVDDDSLSGKFGY